jgi:hypothetical protein
MMAGGDWFIFHEGERVGRVMKFVGNVAKERWVGFVANDRRAGFPTRGEAAYWVLQQAQQSKDLAGVVPRDLKLMGGNPCPAARLE